MARVVLYIYAIKDFYLYVKNKMTKKRNELNKTVNLLFTLLLTSLTTALATATFASNNDNIESYVDSVHHWGPWELDIEPAAGGIALQTTGPLNARDSKVVLRTNSISALAPSSILATQTTPGPSVVPVPPQPAAPVTPPPVTPPIGGPTDGLF